jgi:hypothetical protein
VRYIRGPVGGYDADARALLARNREAKRLQALQREAELAPFRPGAQDADQAAAAEVLAASAPVTPAWRQVGNRTLVRFGPAGPDQEWR